MIKVMIKQEDSNGQEQGYGIYINGYIQDDAFEDHPVWLYASECVPFGQNSPENIKRVTRNVRRRARRAYKRDCMQEN